MPATAAVRSTDAAREAWGYLWQLLVADKPRRFAVLSELGLSMQQSMALLHLNPGEPLAMGALAQAMHCDNSNITGIVDRLEAAGLAERRASERDRRVKTILLTARGEAVRAQAERRMHEPPPLLAALPEADAATLRDILARALDG